MYSPPELTGDNLFANTISESEISNRGHVTLGEVDDDEKTSLQEEIEYPQHDTGTGDFAVPFGPPLQYILNSHITSHLCS